MEIEYDLCFGKIKAKFIILEILAYVNGRKQISIMLHSLSKGSRIFIKKKWKRDKLKINQRFMQLI